MVGFVSCFIVNGLKLPFSKVQFKVNLSVASFIFFLICVDHYLSTSSELFVVWFICSASALRDQWYRKPHALKCVVLLC